MAYSIKVSADVQSFKKDIMGLAKEIDKGLSNKRKIQLFDKDTREFLEKGAKNAIEGIRKEVVKLEDANKKIVDVLRNQNTQEEEMKRRQTELIRNKKKILDLEKDISKTQEAASRVLGGTSKGGQFMGGFKGSFGGIGGLLGKIPGLGGMAGAMGGGGGMMGALGGLAGGGLMGLGSLAVGRMFNGYNTFDQNKGSMIGMMGRGFSREEASTRNPQAQALGLNAEDMRNLQLQATDVFGRSGAGNQKVLDIQRNARGLGIGADQMIGAGQGLRQQLGLSGGQKAFAKLQATLISTELDGAIGPFLETTANMLTQINEHGIGLDSAALAVMSSFGNAKGMSPEMTQKVFSGLDQSIKGATGENAAFYMSALTSSGIGAGSLGGAQMAQSQGLFGGDASKLRERGFIPKKELDELQGQGIISDDSKQGVSAFKKRAGAISGLYGKVTAGMGASGKALVASKLTGIQDPLAAREAMGILEQASKRDLTGKEKKKLEDLQKTPQEQMGDRLKEIADSAAGQLEVAQKFKEDMAEALGEELAPLGKQANEILGSIDKAMVAVAKFLTGGEFETQAEGMAKRAGSGNLSMEEYKGLNPDMQKQVKSQMNDQMRQSMTRSDVLSETGIGGLRDRIGGALMPGSGIGFKDIFSPDQGKVSDDKAKQDRFMALQEQIARAALQTARQGAQPKNTQVQGSGKTRK